MSNIKFVVLLLCVCLGISCSNDRSVETEEVSVGAHVTSIKFEPEHELDVFIEDVLDTSFFKILSTDQNFLLSYIQKIYFSDNVMIIPQDRGKIYLYDLKGEPLRVIDSEGRSGGKLSRVDDVWYSDSTKLINVYGRNPKILSYDLEGKLIKEEKVEEPPGEPGQSQFVRSKDMALFERIHTGGVNNNRLGVYDSDLKFQKSLLPLPERVKRIGLFRTHSLESYRDSLFYLPILETRIYKVNTDSISIAYEFDIPKRNRAPLDYLNAESIGFDDYLDEMRNSDFAHSFERLYISDKYVSFNYQKGGKPFKEGSTSRINVFFSKQSKDVLQFSHLKSKKNPEIKFTVFIVGRMNEYYVTVVHPDQVKQLPESVRNKLSDNSNPVLLFFKLKDF